MDVFAYALGKGALMSDVNKKKSDKIVCDIYCAADSQSDSGQNDHIHSRTECILCEGGRGCK